MKPSFTVILPTYNEKDNAPKLVSEILALPSENDIQVLVVDDDSPDGTASILEQLYGSHERVKVLNRKGQPRGLVNSLNDGIRSSRTEYVIWMDADLQMPSIRILDFIDKVRTLNPTAVIGSRFIPGGMDVRDSGSGNRLSSFHKHLSLFLNLIVPRLLFLPFTDITSGFIAIRKSFFDGYVLRGHHGEYFIELLCVLKDYPCVEIPYELRPRERGVSKTTKGNLLGIIVSGWLYLRVSVKLILSSGREKFKVGRPDRND